MATNNFAKFAKLVAADFQRLTKTANVFVTGVNADQLYATYLAAFPAGTNPLFKTQTEHDCSCCKQFIRRVGNVVTVEDGAVHTVWDRAAEKAPDPYNKVAAMSVINNLFEYAIRNKLRFASTRGDLTAEQLWDVPLRAKNGEDFSLNAVAKAASKAWKEISEEDFVGMAETPERTRRALALDVVKRVIEVKLAEEEAAKTRAANKVEKEKLLKILAEKQEGKLSEMSERELQKRIAALSD